jgi:two-component system OmpR family sensor kinase
VTSPAARRLSRIRWAMTLFFAATTTICLIVLAVIAANIDAASHENSLDADLAPRVTSLANTVTVNDGQLELARLATDSVARTSQAFAIISSGRIQLSSPNQAALPSDSDITRLLDAAAAKKGVVDQVASSASGRGFVWAVAPIPNGASLGAFVLVGASTAQSDAAHNQLILGLTATVVILVLLAAAAGHLLSGRAIRPALRSLEQQEQFLVEAAHELRTPLATLKLVLESGSPTALTRASAQVDRMGDLVTGLLARARAESGAQEVELRTLRLDQLVERTIEDLPDAAGVSMRTQPTVVRGNPELLAQAVRNLVANALRYGDGVVEVEVVDRAISVRDSGPGIPANRRGAVVERGVGSGAGTGTGLAIVSWVAELHGGTLVLADVESGGLLATLTLPASSSSHDRFARLAS